jgi:hypothetical protein
LITLLLIFSTAAVAPSGKLIDSAASMAGARKRIEPAHAYAANFENDVINFV